MDHGDGCTSRHFPRRPTHAEGSTARSLKRRRVAAQQSPDGEEPSVAAESLTEMEKQVRALKDRHADTLLLFECGYRMRIFGEDAEIASRVLGIRAQRHRAFLEASVPVHRTLYHARRLVNAGYKVGIAKQTSIVSSSGQPLERDVVAVYTRATVPLDDADDADLGGARDKESGDEGECADRSDEDNERKVYGSSEGEEASRFILAVVEETVENTRLFTQLVHELSDSIRRTSLVEEVRIGVFGYDVHTGEAVFDEFEDDARRVQLRERLSMIEPVEFVLPASGVSPQTEQTIQSFANPNSGRMEHCDTLQQRVCRVERVHISSAFEAVTPNNVRLPATIAPEGWPSLVQSASTAMVTYLRSLRVETTLSLETVRSRHLQSAMPDSRVLLPASTQRDLNVFSCEREHERSLFGVMNQTQTAFGARCLRNWFAAPLTDVKSIVRRQDAIEHLAVVSGNGAIVYETLRQMLPLLGPLERLLQQLRLRRATPRSLVRLLRMLARVEVLLTELSPDPGNSSTNLIEELLTRCPSSLTSIQTALGAIDIVASEENDLERSISLHQWRKYAGEWEEYRDICSKLSSIEREFEVILEMWRSELDLPNLVYSSHRSGGVGKISDHLFAVQRSDLDRVPEDWYVVSSNKSVVRYYPRQVRALQQQLDMLRELKAQLINSVWLKTIAETDELVYVNGMLCVDILAQLDSLCSLATIARLYPNYTRPSFSEERRFDIVNGRHPVLELHTTQGSSYIPGNLTLSPSDNSNGGAAVIISGPNMGGKSTFLRMVALLTLMAQVGSFVPAASMTLPVFSSILSRMHRGLRTDGLCASAGEDELFELSELMKQATSKSLVLLDEVGYGLTSQQATSLAFSIVKYMSQSVGSDVVVSTHMTEIVDRFRQDEERANLVHTILLGHEFIRETLSGDQSSDPTSKIVYHYTDREGVASRSLAIQAAALSGLPSCILTTAAKKL